MKYATVTAEHTNVPLSSSPSLIEARGLCHSYGEASLRKQILFDLELRISPGEIVILTGPSGCGKTTLLTLVAGLRRVQQGHLRVFEHDLEDAETEDLVAVRRQIGFIFQAHNLLDFLTVRQNVDLIAELHPETSAREASLRTEHLLREVGLAEQINAYPSKLSGGQKQRVAIARALAGRPRLILADEPTAALDGRTGRDVVNLLQRLARDEGFAILMVTHDNRILDVADRIVAMEDGRILAG